MFQYCLGHAVHSAAANHVLGNPLSAVMQAIQKGMMGKLVLLQACWCNARYMHQPTSSGADVLHLLLP